VTTRQHRVGPAAGRGGVERIMTSPQTDAGVLVAAEFEHEALDEIERLAMRRSQAEGRTVSREEVLVGLLHSGLDVVDREPARLAKALRCRAEGRRALREELVHALIVVALEWRKGLI
jgi:hypothetical protein